MKHREFVAAPALMTCLFLGPAASALEREEHGEWHIASAVAERLPSPRADLKTAKTIYISQLPQDLHYHIAALLSLEGPLEVVKGQGAGRSVDEGPGNEEDTQDTPIGYCWGRQAR